MRTYDLSRLSDTVLVRDLRALLGQERIALAAVLAHVAEIDARRLYLPAGYPSMYAYCLGELNLSEESAKKRIRAARTARQFPPIFEAVANGRLHLSSVVLLAPYLTYGNARDLLSAAEGKTRFDVERLIAARFPTTEMLALVQATVDGIRLRCRGHNQLEAECTFGAGFMEEKRERARDARAREHASTRARERTYAPKLGWMREGRRRGRPHRSSRRRG